MYSFVANYGTESELIVKNVASAEDFLNSVKEELNARSITDYTELEAGIKSENVLKNKSLLAGKYLLTGNNTLTLVEKVLKKGYLYNGHEMTVINNWKIIPDRDMYGSLVARAKQAEEELAKKNSEAIIQQTVEEVIKSSAGTI